MQTNGQCQALARTCVLGCSCWCVSWYARIAFNLEQEIPFTSRSAKNISFEQNWGKSVKGTKKRGIDTTAPPPQQHHPLRIKAKKTIFLLCKKIQFCLFTEFKIGHRFFVCCVVSIVYSLSVSVSVSVSMVSVSVSVKILSVVVFCCLMHL